ncbi:MAG: tetratricopeptide repeat protein [Candidatus Omnitrophota bacterium]
MKVFVRIQCLILLFIISVCFPCCLFAETIILKSKETIKGQIINKSDKYIVINVNGADISYSIDLIESIDGEKISEFVAAEESSGEKRSVDSVTVKTEYVFGLDTGNYINRGLTSQIRGDYEQAISDFTKAIEINPNDAHGYNNRGLIYEIKGSYDQAIADFNKAIEINPDFEGPYCNRGNTYFDIGNYDQALADFSKDIELHPNSSIAYYGRANTYMHRGSYEQAIFDFTKAITITPDYAEAYCNRGLVYTRTSNYDQALADFNKAIEINPKYAAAYNNRAVIYYQKKNYAGSWQDVYKAEELGAKVNPGLIAALNKAYPLQSSKPVVFSKKMPSGKKINYYLEKRKKEGRESTIPSEKTGGVVFQIMFFGGIIFMMLIAGGFGILIYKLLPKNKKVKTCSVEEFPRAQFIVIPLSDGREITIKPDSNFFIELINNFTNDTKPPVDNIDSMKLYIKIRNKKYALAVSLSGWNFQGEKPNCRVLQNSIQMIRIINSIQKDYLKK